MIALQDIGFCEKARDICYENLFVMRHLESKRKELASQHEVRKAASKYNHQSNSQKS